MLLSKHHAEMCKVKVGDAMPELRLPDISGKEADLAALKGEKATVVLFWSPGQLASLEALSDLGYDVATPYAGQGVKVVAIATGLKAQEAGKHASDAEVTYPVLVDADGTAFAQVGHGKLPRLFVLDHDGKILWFDIEYSRSTRRDLKQSLKAILGDAAGA